MKTKEEILAEFRDTPKSNQWKFWASMLELLADIRDEQVRHNGEMERIENPKVEG